MNAEERQAALDALNAIMRSRQNKSNNKNTGNSENKDKNNVSNGANDDYADAWNAIMSKYDVDSVSEKDLEDLLSQIHQGKIQNI